MAVADALVSLATPSLILDEARMLRNIARLGAHLGVLGVPLRPHLKTAKSVEVARRVLEGGTGAATVSTLKEVDSPEQAEAVASASRRAGDRIPVLIEIDSDGHRSGLLPHDPTVIAVGPLVANGGAELRAVVTHAGESYGAAGGDALAEFAERERRAAVAAAEALRAPGSLRRW